ncbi:C40 family peptidase [Streptomyces corynorhini]|uniref:NlpC/P60 family protein n=1 Tax=Streptomyces corynorhini TaxID=2282652 RepID=A0A370BAU0_9ACTN|nr:C40 family peptidase [Streptomyces corynorhini]RDG38751.1 NlpC/P60 family protein [Streptomyces corynorhini]
MSHTAHIPSHRKPRRSAPKVTVLRAGVAGGVLSTIAVAGAAGPANAEPVTQTIEMPTLTSGLASDFAKSADATQRVANNLDLRAQESAAITKATKAAKTAHAEAERKAEAEKKKKAAAEARAKAAAEAERASRDAQRTTLAAADSGSNYSSGSSSSGSSTGTTAASAPTTSTATGSAAAVVAFVQSHVGDAYIMGSTGPNAWDCSGLVQAAYNQIGVNLPRVSQSQSTAGTQVSLSNLQPGDILYWGGAGSAYHTAIYIGDGQFVGAQNPSKGVVQASLDYDPPSGAVRVL